MPGSGEFSVRAHRLSWVCSDRGSPEKDSIPSDFLLQFWKLPLLGLKLGLGQDSFGSKDEWECFDGWVNQRWGRNTGNLDASWQKLSEG